MTPKPASKFTFDTEFRDGAAILSGAAHARQKISFTNEEIAAIRARSQDEGAKAAQVRASEAISQNIAALVAVLRQALDQSGAEIEELRAEATALAFAVARKIAPVALAALPAGDVEAALREAMHQAIGEPYLTLRAGPDVVAALAPHIAAIAHEEGYDGRVMISADPTIRAADCRIEWRGGGSERSQAATLSALDALIERHFSHLQPSTDIKG